MGLQSGVLSSALEHKATQRLRASVADTLRRGLAEGTLQKALLADGRKRIATCLIQASQTGSLTKALDKAKSPVTQATVQRASMVMNEVAPKSASQAPAEGKASACPTPANRAPMVANEAPADAKAPTCQKPTHRAPMVAHEAPEEAKVPTCQRPAPRAPMVVNEALVEVEERTCQNPVHRAPHVVNEEAPAEAKSPACQAPAHRAPMVVYEAREEVEAPTSQVPAHRAPMEVDKAVAGEKSAHATSPSAPIVAKEVLQKAPAKHQLPSKPTEKAPSKQPVPKIQAEASSKTALPSEKGKAEDAHQVKVDQLRRIAKDILLRAAGDGSLGSALGFADDSSATDSVTNGASSFLREAAPQSSKTVAGSGLGAVRAVRAAQAQDKALTVPFVMELSGDEEQASPKQPAPRVRRTRPSALLDCAEASGVVALQTPATPPSTSVSGATRHPRRPAQTPTTPAAQPSTPSSMAVPRLDLNRTREDSRAAGAMTSVRTSRSTARPAAMSSRRSSSVCFSAMELDIGASNAAMEPSSAGRETSRQLRRGMSSSTSLGDLRVTKAPGALQALRGPVKPAGDRFVPTLNLQKAPLSLSTGASSARHGWSVPQASARRWGQPGADF